MSQMDQKYDAISQKSDVLGEWSVEELNIVDLDDRLELADRCSNNSIGKAD